MDSQGNYLQEIYQLHKAEYPWRPGRIFETAKSEELDETEARTQGIYKRVKSILNKLTPQKFKTLLKQVQDLNIDTETRLKGVTDLIYEQAVSEPMYSVTYANMCRYLMQLKVPSDSKPGEKINFRVILLTKCQREFEKDKDADLKARQKKIDEAVSEDVKKQLQEEMEIAATTARRRSIRNIRFIGELFKLKMLTENIMHDCVFKLLRSRDEENLECLCRLLTTIGKELDKEKAKPRVDQYFQKMQKIVGEKKTSSRVRFMLQDVIDLRLCNWVPRREDNNPKTIDQIHKEAAKENAQRTYMLSQNPPQSSNKQSRDGGRSRGGGPPNRGGPQQNNQRNDDGWNTVASKPLRNIDLSKMKITKTTVDENIQVGPGGGSSRFGVWGRGSNNGDHINSSSQEGDSPAKAPANRNLTGRTTPSSSNPASRERSRSREPRMDKPEAAPVPGILSEDEMEKKTKTIIDEYLHINDLKEALMCVSEISNPATVHLFIEFSINHVLERSSKARQQTGHLHHDLVSKKIISVDSYLKGLNQTLQIAEDMEIDIPKIWQYLGELIGPMIQDGSVPLNFLKQACEPLQASGKSGVVVAAVLHDASQRLGHKKVASLWKSSALEWTDFVSAKNVTEFLADEKLEFTVAADSQPSTPVDKVSFETIQEQLLVRLRDVNFDNEHMFDWIEANIPDESTKNPKFIRTLMTVVCKSAVSEGPNYKVNENVIKQRQSLLVKYLDSQQEFEIQALYALQAFVKELQHPGGVLRTFFETLYDEDIISEDAFNQWSNSNDPAEQEGKGVAMKQVVHFFAWLKEGEQDES
ncbi:eukaryotic translation initiation factor 4 gamma 3 isoform X2 [Patella vulgata]|uniref:eukaryotic translation initiation factor 4 gamma 3 isoform X2 n=1 Tax=Patella vulgata TaxID=6465 RepID=UPI0024A7FF7E|nr:eukaryotic translation initiation factor 4 gamma 3 isoform X2 [Patella vulgata]